MFLYTQCLISHRQGWENYFAGLGSYFVPSHLASIKIGEGSEQLNVSPPAMKNEPFPTVFKKKVKIKGNSSI